MHEYRIDWGPGYRVYFGRDGDTLVILLTGGTKQRQQRDIARARGPKTCGRTTSGGASRPRDERRRAMALTREFKELMQQRIARDPAFGDALLREGIDTMLAGDVDTGKAILRDYIKATVGFEKLGEATGTPPKASSACSGRAAIRRCRFALTSALLPLECSTKRSTPAKL